MFKRLKERLAEEANKFPVGQHAFGNTSGKPPDSSFKPSDRISNPMSSESTEDLITISDSSAVIVPHSSNDNFSIADEDGFLSDQSSPKKNVHKSSILETSNSSAVVSKSEVHKDSFQQLNSNVQVSALVPHTDIESEVDDTSALNLDDISKEQLVSAILKLKAKLRDYKKKYSEVNNLYKTSSEDKKKLERVLTEHQDKNKRRITELREQYILEQKAKADLGLLLDEKDSTIKVLNTQISLLKENQLDNSSSNNATVSSSSMTDEKEVLDSLLCQELPVIPSEPKNESDFQLKNDVLIEKIKELETTLQEKEKKLCEESEIVISMKNHINDLTLQLEHSDISIAQVKQDFHKELELKEIRIKQLLEEIQALNLAILNERSHQKELEQKYDAIILEIQLERDTLKTNIDEDRQLHESVLQQKREAIKCLQQAHEEKIKEWKVRLEALQKGYQEEVTQKEQKLTELQAKEAECLLLQETIKEKNSMLKELQQEKDKLQQHIETLSLCNENKEDNSTELSVKEAEFKEQIAKYENEISALNLKYNSEIIELKTEMEHLNHQQKLKEQELLEKLSKNESDLKFIKEHMNEKECLIQELQQQLKCQDEKDHNSECERLNAEMNQLIVEKKLLDTKNNETEVINQSLKNSNDELQKQICNFENEIVLLKGQLSQLECDKNAFILNLQEEFNVKTSDYELQLMNKESQCQSLITEKETIFKELLICREEIKNLNEQIISEKEKLESSLNSSKLLVSELEDSKIKLSYFEDSVFNTTRDFVALSQEFTNKQSEFELELMEKQEKLEIAIEEKENAEHKLIILKKEIKSLEDQIEGLKSSNLACKEELKNKMKQNNEEYCLKLQVMNEQMKSLEEQIECLKSLNVACEEELKNKMNQNKEEYSMKLNKEIENLVLYKSNIVSTIKDLCANAVGLQTDMVDLSKCFNVCKAQVQEDCTNIKEVIEAIMKLKQESDEQLNHLNEKLCKLGDENLFMKMVLESCGLLTEKVDIYALMKMNKENNSEYRDYLDSIKYYVHDSMMAENEYLKRILKRDKTNSCEPEYDDFDSFENNNELESDRPLKINNSEKMTFTEIHENYKVLLQEKDTIIKNLEAKCKVIEETPDVVYSETSDWDESWVVPEDPCQSTSPVSNDEIHCDKYAKQIETMQEELKKSNSELNDLRFLLEMYSSSNNFSTSSSPMPEPTEFEYLKNILFAYMMGKETETLAKVIAAVLKFNEEQTKMIIEKEKMKHLSKH